MAAKKTRKKKIALAVLGVLLVAPIAVWEGIQHIPWLGPALADGARSIVGPKPVAWLEDTLYGIQDDVNQVRYSDAKPTEYWEAPTGSTSADAAIMAPRPIDSSFPPPAGVPPFANVAAAGDGVWIPVPDPHDPSGPTGLYKTLIHPDPKRGYAVVAVVAMDLRKVDITAVPGFGEPQSSALPRDKRPGTVPTELQPNLLAVFNGGFQAVHGRWGMMVDGTVLLPARPIGCVVARYKDGDFRVGVWKALADTESDMSFYRQTPPCLLAGGQINPATVAETNTGWGATVDGDTIIRRSAFGLDEKHAVAFYGMGDALSAGSLARAMKSAGAWDVAQLDVNHSYPRFLIFDGATATPPKVDHPLAPIPQWNPKDYVITQQLRDFFAIRWP